MRDPEQSPKSPELASGKMKRQTPKQKPTDKQRLFRGQIGCCPLWAPVLSERCYGLDLHLIKKVDNYTLDPISTIRKANWTEAQC